MRESFEMQIYKMYKENNICRLYDTYIYLRIFIHFSNSSTQVQM